MKPLYAAATWAILGAAPVWGQSSVDYATVGLNSTTASLAGFTACRAELELAFAVSGLIAETLIDEGQFVQQGDLLMSLDQQIEAIDVERRKAVMEDDAELRAAKAREIIAQAQMQSAQTLYDTTGGISLEEVQNRTLAYELARIEILRLQAQARINALDYETARENLARRSLFAPSDGIISKIEIQTGESAQVNDPVLMLCDLSQLEFTANIPVSIADGLQKDMTVSVHIASRDQTVSGRVKFVSPIVDSASGLQQVKVSIAQTYDWLRPGMSANLVLRP